MELLSSIKFGTIWSNLFTLLHFANKQRPHRQQQQGAAEAAAVTAGAAAAVTAGVAGGVTAAAGAM